MSVIKYEDMKAAVLNLKSVAAIAAHFGCDERAAFNMRLLVESETKKKISPVIPLISKPKLAKENPKDDSLCWSYEKEKQMMVKGSFELICAMLNAGQHKLSPETASELKHHLGI